MFCHTSVGRANRHHQQSLPAAATSRIFSASKFLYEIANWDGDPETVTQLLAAAFGAEGYLECIKNLEAHGIRPLLYIDSLDKVSTHSILMQHTQFVTAGG